MIAAQAAASRLVQELSITSPEQIVLEDIAMSRGVFVIEDELQGAEARLVRRGLSGLIRVKVRIPEMGRKRFAIAHELGHWELHRNEVLSVCTADEIGGYVSVAPEIEANTFAGELLMPTKLFRPRCESATPDLELVCSLADEFQTTVSSTALRFVEECRETCVAVFTENRAVKWWRAREGAGIWIERGLPVDHRSEAWASTGRGRMERVTSEVWFPEWRGRPREVYEQSMPLGRYGIVLTLLWVLEKERDDDDSE